MRGERGLNEMQNFFGDNLEEPPPEYAASRPQMCVIVCV